METGSYEGNYTVIIDNENFNQNTIAKIVHFMMEI